MTEKKVPYKTVGVRISKNAIEVVNKEAVKERRSVSAVIRIALEEYFDKRGIKLPL